METIGRRDRVQALVTRNEKVLLVKHRMNDRVFFCLPGGGVEEGETYEQAALRELKEESLVNGRIIRKLSVQYKPDNRGEVHTFLIEVDEDAVPGVGTDPELSDEEQTIIGVEWLSLEELGEADKAYLWSSGLNRVDFFHEKLLSLENRIFK
ncbi:MAG: NUDIX domain-containing protein [Lachnospiraceae bacterium]|nr:NUDIX domain-containing protein [Lachnospiraceae bacterium]